MASPIPEVEPVTKATGRKLCVADIDEAFKGRVKVSRYKKNIKAELFTTMSKMQETREFYERLGATPMTGGPTQMHEFQKKEIALWQRIVQKAHVPQQ